MVKCIAGLIYSVVVLLAADEGCAFVSPAGLTSLASRRAAATPSSTSLARSSRRWDTQQQTDAVGSGEAGMATDKVRVLLVLMLLVAKHTHGSVVTCRMFVWDKTRYPW